MFTPSEIGSLIDAYIVNRNDAKLPITRRGLAVYINSTVPGKHINADTITDYDKIDEYGEHIKRLDDASYVFTVDCMFTKQNPAGPIFFAKNAHGMADKQDIYINTSDLLQITPDQAEQLLQAAVESRQRRLAEAAGTVVEADYEVK
jgi:hypothetical protein